MRLAYQDMSLERKKQEEKLKASDPKKAQQLERLGMGFISNKLVSSWEFYTFSYQQADI